jgi:hypothetical protein
MQAMDDPIEAARLHVVAALDEYAAALRGAEGIRLGDGLIQTRALKDRVEAIFVESLRRFDQAGDFVHDGAVDLVAWVRSRCKLSGAEAAQRVGVARQLEHLPQAQKALASGELGLQQVAVLACAAEHIGPEVIKKAEATLVGMAERMDVGQFTGAVKSFEHQVDAQAALADANRAHQRRYLNLSDRADGMVQLEGLLDAEGGAIVRTALHAHLLPGRDDQRTPGQRRADGLVEICRGNGRGSTDGSGPRPHVIVRTTVETLAGLEQAPAGELDGGAMVPAETVRRLACDAALTRIVGQGELEGEISRASRSVSASMRRALAMRDRGCVAEHCGKPARWTDGHHLEHWARGGPTTMANVVLLCRPHHRMVHEEGYHLQKLPTGRWRLLAPTPSSRSA